MWPARGEHRELSDLVRFEHHNLRGSIWPAAASFDAIFCRNVLIYFNQHAVYRPAHKAREHT